MTWKPINTAPKDGRAILLLSAANEVDMGPNGTHLHKPQAHIGYWSKNGDAWVDRLGRLGGECYELEITGLWMSGGGWFQPNEVTHWMEIPMPPKGTEVPPDYTADCGCVFSAEGKEKEACDRHK